MQLVAERAGDASLPSALADLYARNQRMLGDVDRERRRLLRDSALVTKAQAAVAAYADARSEPQYQLNQPIVSRLSLTQLAIVRGLWQITFLFSRICSATGAVSHCAASKILFQISLLCDWFAFFRTENVKDRTLSQAWRRQ